jgi:serralysin
MNRLFTKSIALITGSASTVLAQNPMMDSVNGYRIFSPIFTVGESFGNYTPPGILDGMGAYQLDENTVRVLANHELLHFRGYPYEVNDAMGGTFSMIGARISYFDIDIESRQIVGSGLAYNTVYDANGNIASDLSFQPTPYAPFFGGPDDAAPLAGFSRFCSSVLIEPMQFNGQRGMAERVYLTGEEDGGGFNSVGGAEWALDPETGSVWHLPDLGRGAWENVCELDTGNADQVAILLSDDSSPYDFDADGTSEAAPLYLYIGNKDANGDFPTRNGLRNGTLYV